MTMNIPILYIFLAYFCETSSAAGDTEIIATAPVNPVRVGDMLCLHCHVKNKGKEQELTIFRIANGKFERLVWNEGILEDVDSRVFLAVRQLDDGSVVYFLSVTDVNRQDEGNYTCKVIVPDTLESVTEATAEVRVQYFPPEEYPICATNTNSFNVYSGTYAHLNCTSLKGHPRVDVTWKQSGHDMRSTMEESERFITSKASVKLTKHHNGAIFVCEIRSSAFPDEVRTCHIGPYNVFLRPGHDDDVNTVDMPITAIAPELDPDAMNPGVSITVFNKDVSHKTGQAVKCGQICSNLEDSNLLLWRIATAVACGLALIFLIMGITIAVKLSNLTPQNVHVKTRTFEPGETRPMYEDLLRRRGDDQVYMAIDKASMDKTTVVGMDIDHYHTAQDVPGSQRY